MKYLKNYSLIIIIFILLISKNSFSQKDDVVIYITQKDESIFKIAEKFDIDYHIILSENFFKSNYIKKNTEVKIKGFKTLPYKEKVFYEVKPNEDVYKIAKKFSLNPDKIIADNNIKNPYLLVIGTRLLLENTKKTKSENTIITINPIIKKEIYHISQKGESLYSISQKYNKNFSDILFLNKNIKTLFSNQKVLVDKYYELNTNFNGLILNSPERKLYLVRNKKFKSYNLLSYHDNFELYKEYKITYKIKNPDKGLDSTILNKIIIQNKNKLSSKLGAYWIGLDWLGNGIHCTNGLNSESFSKINKTIKLNCNDALDLFNNININEKFIVINEPIKLYIEDNNIFLEVYKSSIENYNYKDKIEDIISKYKNKIDFQKVNQLILKKEGIKEKISF
ncbi:MAG: hypothetical protein KatS3mg068_1222 [Candidatus Sericytochromatia bacterium]|nr:MAG: hypothetical protein KatS3mg068_1222 [Candidatus Sericytochromatia bacterium]